MAKLFVQSIYGICKRHAYLLRGRNLAEGHAEGACLHDLPPRNTTGSRGGAHLVGSTSYIATAHCLG